MISGRKLAIIIKELLETVHAAMDSKEITSVAFSWIKYITDRRRSGPGYLQVLIFLRRVIGIKGF